MDILKYSMIIGTTVNEPDKIWQTGHNGLISNLETLMSSDGGTDTSQM